VLGWNGIGNDVERLDWFVLPGAVLVIYTLLTRDWALWARLHMGKGLILFFAITAPWFILIALKNPEHPHFFFIHEHFQRFTSGVHNRGGAWYYFFLSCCWVSCPGWACYCRVYGQA
jgi:4-amino-4-deoxy-L-arabinose transferase-like glycosyltransferase